MRSHYFLNTAGLSAGLLLIFIGAAVAQSTNKKADSKKLAATPLKNAWSVNCSGAQTGSELICRMVQNVIIAKTKQRLLSVVIQPAEKAKNHMLVMALPHGINIPEGVELQVDDLKGKKLVIKTSDQSGIYTSEPIDDVLLASLRKGQKLKISYTFVSGKRISIPLGLQGFAAAYKKLSQI